MADLNTELEKLALAKAAIRESINNKGVEVDSSLPFREYASKIDEIGGSRTYNPYFEIGDLSKVEDRYLTVDSTGQAIKNTIKIPINTDSTNTIDLEFVFRLNATYTSDSNASLLDANSQNFLALNIYDSSYNNFDIFNNGNKYSVNYGSNHPYTWCKVKIHLINENVGSSNITITRIEDGIPIVSYYFSHRLRQGMCYWLLGDSNSAAPIIIDLDSVKLTLDEVEYKLTNKEAKYTVLQSVIPSFNANSMTNEDGTWSLVASSETSLNQVWLAFDGDISTGDRCWWTGNSPNFPVTISLTCPIPIKFNTIKLKNEHVSPEYYNQCVITDGNNGNIIGTIANDFTSGSYNDLLLNSSYTTDKINFSFSKYSSSVSLQEVLIMGLKEITL